MAEPYIVELDLARMAYPYGMTDDMISEVQLWVAEELEPELPGIEIAFVHLPDNPPSCSQCGRVEEVSVP